MTSMKYVHIFVLLALTATALAVPTYKHEKEVSKEEGRIFGGSLVKQGQYPFVVAFIRPGYTDCTGTILTKNWVLTAGTCCFFVGHEFKVFVGSVNLDNGGKLVEVNKTIYHPEFEISDDAGLTHPNDVCVVKLQAPLKFNKRIQPVTLPPADYPFEGPTPASVLGWGAKNDSYWNTSRRLMIYTNMTVYPGTCPRSQDMYSEVPFVGMICAENQAAGHNACMRDEGGPLLYKNYMQIGLFSYYHEGNCEKSRTSTFARVAHYVPWIQAVLGDEARDLKIADYKEVPCRFSYCSPW